MERRTRRNIKFRNKCNKFSLQLIVLQAESKENTIWINLTRILFRVHFYGLSSGENGQIALFGHFPTQIPQSVHFSGIIYAFLSLMIMAFSLQCPIQNPHMMHLSFSTIYGTVQTSFELADVSQESDFDFKIQARDLVFFLQSETDLC